MDGEQPVYEPPSPGPVPNLEADLARDPAFLADLADDRFARAVYTTLQNRDFRKAGSLRRWGISHRRAGSLIANLRGLRESYMDYFPHGDLDGIYPDEREAYIAQMAKSEGNLSIVAKIAEAFLKAAPNTPETATKPAGNGGGTGE